MTFTQYANETAETAIYPDAGKGTPLALSYAVMGLVGELGELALAKGDCPKETGDVMWYVARVMVEAGGLLDEADKLIAFVYSSPKPPADKIAEKTCINGCYVCLSTMCNSTKKLLRDGPSDKHMSSVRIAVLEALELIARNAYRYNLDLYEVLEQNQKKLRDRKERGVLKGSGDNR